MIRREQLLKFAGGEIPFFGRPPRSEDGLGRSSLVMGGAGKTRRDFRSSTFWRQQLRRDFFLQRSLLLNLVFEVVSLRPAAAAVATQRFFSVSKTGRTGLCQTTTAVRRPGAVTAKVLDR